MKAIQITELPDTGDNRGSSFQFPEQFYDFLKVSVDTHLMTMKPNKIRGNHYHALHREILVVIHSDKWSFYWDSGLDTNVEKHSFSGKGTVMIFIQPNASHAVKNDGNSDLVVMGFSNLKFDPEKPDSHIRIIVNN